MMTKEIIYVPKEESKDLILATFGKFFEHKKDQQLTLELTKFTKSLRLAQGKQSFKGRIRKNQDQNEFLFHETDKNLFIYELDLVCQMQKEENP
jgi:hypothetical protein